jgi:hypothetical protein
MIYFLPSLAMLLIAGGHLVRDGTPPLGSTHLARAIGGLLCVAGAATVTLSWGAVLLGLAIWAGFYADYGHAVGQRARHWGDAGWLAISGFTSVLPLTAALAWGGFSLPVMAGLVPFAAAVLKPAIWFEAYAVNAWTGNWFSPTRAAATVFGAFVGLTLVWLSP